MFIYSEHVIKMNIYERIRRLCQGGLHSENSRQTKRASNGTVLPEGASDDDRGVGRKPNGSNVKCVRVMY